MVADLLMLEGFFVLFCFFLFFFFGVIQEALSIIYCIVQV